MFVSHANARNSHRIGSRQAQGGHLLRAPLTKPRFGLWEPSVCGAYIESPLLTSRQSVDPPISTRYPVDLALLLEDNPHHFEEPAARCFGSFERPLTVFPRLIRAFQGNPSVPPVRAERGVCRMEPPSESQRTGCCKLSKFKSW